MFYLMMFNTLAVLLLIIQTIFYINTSTKLNGCHYDIDQVWCYNDLQCANDSSNNDEIKVEDYFS